MFGFVSEDRVARLEREIRAQDVVIDELCRKLGVRRDDTNRVNSVDAQERALIAEGKQIAAVKHHRERTGSGLLEAKNIIDGASRST